MTANLPLPPSDSTTDASDIGSELSYRQLRANSINGGLVSLLAMAVSQLLRLVILAVLAHLLRPEDFGLLAMTVTWLALGAVFRDLGLSAATIQRDQLTPQQSNTLFWVNVGFGAAATLVGMACAPLVAAFFGDERLAAIARVLSLGFLIGGLGAQHSALLMRHMRFRVSAAIQLLTALAGGGAAVALALAGAGYWALVAQNLVADALFTALAWRYSGWQPTRPAFDPSVRPMLSFGGHMVAFGWLTYLANNVYAMLLGRGWGAAVLGQYTRADLLSKILQSYVNLPISNVAQPVLSRLQNDTAAYARYYLDCLRIIALLALPLSGACMVLAPDLVRGLFGAQWTDAGRLLRELAPSMAALAFGGSTSWLYLSCGRSAAMLRWGAASWTVILAATLLGLYFGPEGVAIAYSAAMLALTLPCLAYAFRGTSLRLADAVRVSAAPFGATCITTLITAAVHWLLGGQNLWVRLPLCAVTFACVYAVLLVTVFGQRDVILSLFKHLRSNISSSASNS